ncbi:MAG: hypothetical protein ACOC30_01765, partial [Marinilabilia sp.]
KNGAFDFLEKPFSVEEVNRLVLQGVPFREAYRQVGQQIEAGKFSPETSDIRHTHEGSMGNLCNREIKEKMDATVREFTFERVNKAVKELTE